MAKEVRRRQRAVSTRVSEKKRKSNRLGVFAIVSATIIVIVAICIQNSRLEKKLERLQEKEQYYAELLEEENKRTAELEEYAKYVKTKAYIEESAKKLGLVYPDEIIFKPKEE